MVHCEGGGVDSFCWALRVCDLFLYLNQAECHVCPVVLIVPKGGCLSFDVISLFGCVFEFCTCLWQARE